MAKVYYGLIANALLLVLGWGQLFFNDKAEWQGILFSIGLWLLLALVSWFLERKAAKSAIIFAPVGFLMTASWLILWRLNPIWGIKQLVWISLGLLVLVLAVRFMQRVPKERVLKAQYGWLFVTFLLLAAPLVVGFEKGGATSWIDLGVVTVQPSEPAKVTFLLFLVSWYKNTKRPNYKQVAFLLISVLVLLGLLVLQIDLGTALIFYSVFIIVMYLATGRRIWVIIGLSVLIVAALVAYQNFGHVRIRVANWLEPWNDPTGRGYQLIQALGAFAAGSWLGLGLGGGKPYMIPVAQTDFIFAVIGEQFGFIGCCVVLGAFIALLFLAAQRLPGIKTRGSFLLASGLVFYFMAQCLIIIGGVTKLIPLTGVTLPFVSYGGSSMLTCLGALGIVIGLLSETGEAIALQRRKINRIKWVFAAGFVLVAVNLFYWQIIRQGDILAKMLDVI